MRGAFGERNRRKKGAKVFRGNFERHRIANTGRIKRKEKSGNQGELIQ